MRDARRRCAVRASFLPRQWENPGCSSERGCGRRRAAQTHREAMVVVWGRASRLASVSVAAYVLYSYVRVRTSRDLEPKSDTIVTRRVNRSKQSQLIRSPLVAASEPLLPACLTSARPGSLATRARLTTGKTNHHPITISHDHSSTQEDATFATVVTLLIHARRRRRRLRCAMGVV